MPISEKKKASNSRYLEKCDTINFRPPKETGEAIRAAAAAAGESVRGSIMRACLDRIERDRRAAGDN